MEKPRFNTRARKLASNIVAIIVAFMMVFYQTPISYAMDQPDSSAAAETQQGNASTDQGQKASGASGGAQGKAVNANATLSGSAASAAASSGSGASAKASETTPSGSSAAADTEKAGESKDALSSEDAAKKSGDAATADKSDKSKDAAKADTKRTYIYEDASVKVTATLDKADAILRAVEQYIASRQDDRNEQ